MLNQLNFTGNGQSSLALARGAAAVGPTTPRVARAGKGMNKEDARGVLHEIFIRSVLLMGLPKHTGTLKEVVFVSRGAAAPMGRIMSFINPRDPGVFGEAQTLVGHTGPVGCVTLLDDGRLVSGSDDMTLIVWTADDDGVFKKGQILSGHTDVVGCVAPLNDGGLVSGSNDGKLFVWKKGDDEEFAIVQTLKSQYLEAVRCVAVLADGRILSGGEHAGLRVWKKGAMVQTLMRPSGRTGHVQCVAKLKNGSIVTGHANKTLNVWETEGDDRNFKLVQTLGAAEQTGDGVCCVAPLTLVVNDDFLVSGTGGEFGIGDNTLKVWEKECSYKNTYNRTALLTLSGHSKSVCCVAQLDDGRIVSGSDDKTLIVWEKGDGGVEAQILSGHTDGVSCVALLVDGRLVSGSWDGTLKVWWE